MKNHELEVKGKEVEIKNNDITALRTELQALRTDNEAKFEKYNVDALALNSAIEREKKELQDLKESKAKEIEQLQNELIDAKLKADMLPEKEAQIKQLEEDLALKSDLQGQDDILIANMNKSREVLLGDKRKLEHEVFVAKGEIEKLKNKIKADENDKPLIVELQRKCEVMKAEVARVQDIHLDMNKKTEQLEAELKREKEKSKVEAKKAVEMCRVQMERETKEEKRVLEVQFHD